MATTPTFMVLDTLQLKISISLYGLFQVYILTGMIFCLFLFYRSLWATVFALSFIGMLIIFKGINFTYTVSVSNSTVFEIFFRFL